VHSQKRTMRHRLVVVKKTGMKLTVSLAIWAGGSVFGWLLIHPVRKYFAVAKIQRVLVTVYALRKGIRVEVVVLWLAQN
ncbi:vitamin B12 dependent-methionine synthase activation domain-containing protein, partial [Salmonella enterica subsp. enterica serovar Infantis]